MTLPQTVSAFVLLAFGGGILAVAWRGYRAGVLPALAGMAPPLRVQ